MKELRLGKRAISAMLGAMLLVPMANADVAINEENFPDAEFRNYLTTGTKWKDGVKVAIDEDGDGTLTDAEISTIGGVYLYNNKNVKSLKGIEYLTSVWQVNVYNDDITELDLSALSGLVNVQCYGNTNLKTLKLPSSGNVTYLWSSKTAIENLDLSTYNKLSYLNLGDCSNLKTIQIPTNNTKLTSLTISGAELTTIDVSGLKSLTELDLSNNKLTSIDVSKNPSLTSLNCSGNPFTTLRLTSGTLKKLVCANTELPTIDVTGCTKLTDLDIYDNKKMTTYEAPKNMLQNLQCMRCGFTTLDISDYTALIYFDCSDNDLGASGMDFSSANVKTLKQVKCSKTGLTSIDVSNLDNLEVLYVNDNYLNTLDLSKNEKLRELQYRNNYLVEIDLSKNSKIENYNVSYAPTGNARTINVDYKYEEDGEDVYYIDLTGNELNKESTMCELVEKLQPSNFEVAKVSEWNGATVEESPYENTPILKLKGKPEYITYVYSTGYNGGISERAGQTQFRLNLTYNDVKTAINDVESDGVSVRTKHGAIKVEGATGAVNVYSMDGRQVYAGQESEIELPNGMYIVNVGGHVEKVLVR